MIYTRLHILLARPTVSTNPRTLPSIEFEDQDESASAIVSIIGDAEDRQAFAAELRKAAAFFEAWTEADGKAAAAVDEAVPA